MVGWCSAASSADSCDAAPLAAIGGRWSLVERGVVGRVRWKGGREGQQGPAAGSPGPVPAFDERQGWTRPVRAGSTSFPALSRRGARGRQPVADHHCGHRGWGWLQGLSFVRSAGLVDGTGKPSARRGDDVGFGGDGGLGRAIRAGAAGEVAGRHHDDGGDCQGGECRRPSDATFRLRTSSCRGRLLPGVVVRLTE